MAKENKKFIYQVVKPGTRAREYEGALNWLNDASLIHKSYLVTKTDFPLSAYHNLNSFKIFMNDIGLLRRMARLDGSIILEGNKLFSEFKGVFTENYAFNSLNQFFKDEPNYYTFNQYEIDFVIQFKNKIIPIEVKASQNKKHISLTKYNENNENEISLCFSLDNLKKDGKVLNVPLYFIEYLENILERKE